MEPQNGCASDPRQGRRIDLHSAPLEREEGEHGGAREINQTHVPVCVAAHLFMCARVCGAGGL